MQWEARQSLQVLPGLQAVFEGWLGDPIELRNEVEDRQVQAIRRAVFGGAPRIPMAHLGEAMTLFVIQNWTEFHGSTWISNDQDSVEYARRQQIRVMETLDVMREIVADGDITPREAFSLMHLMAQQDRGLRLPSHVRDLEA